MSYNHVTDRSGPPTALARLMAGPAAQAERCDLCRLELEDCLHGIPGACMRCATCGKRDQECAVDCGEADHYAACPFPSEPCICKHVAAEQRARAADVAADMAIDDHLEERPS